MKKLTVFVLAILIIIVPSTMVLADDPNVTNNEAKTLEKIGNKMNNIANMVEKDETSFQKAAEKLNNYIDKAGSDGEYTTKEIKNIEKLANNVDREAKDLQNKCDKVTNNADDLTDVIINVLNN